jgi:hypothetical protein
MTTPSAPPADVRLYPHLDVGTGKMTTSGAPPNDVRLYSHLDVGTGEMTTSGAPPNDVRLYPQDASTNFRLAEITKLPSTLQDEATQRARTRRKYKTAYAASHAVNTTACVCKLCELCGCNWHSSHRCGHNRGKGGRN